MDYKHTCDTIYTHFWGITDNMYGFGRLFIFDPSFFYPSKWRVDVNMSTVFEKIYMTMEIFISDRNCM